MYAVIDLAESELEVLKSWHDHGLPYLIVGGYAMHLYGMPDRLPNDVDVWIDTSLDEHATKLNRSLTSLGCPLRASQVKQPKTYFQVGYSYIQVHLSFDEIDFNAAYEARLQVQVCGLIVSVVSAIDLLRIKQIAAKDPRRAKKEQEDIEFLKKLLGYSH